MIKHVESVQEFDELIKQGKVLVDFYAAWCGPCNMLTPVLEEIDEQGLFEDCKVLKINVDDLMEIASRYGIQSIPTLFYMKDGQIIRRSLGYINKNQVLKLIAE